MEERRGGRGRGRRGRCRGRGSDSWLSRAYSTEVAWVSHDHRLAQHEVLCEGLWRRARQPDHTVRCGIIRGAPFKQSTAKPADRFHGGRLARCRTGRRLRLLLPDPLQRRRQLNSNRLQNACCLYTSVAWPSHLWRQRGIRSWGGEGTSLGKPPPLSRESAYRTPTTSPSSSDCGGGQTARAVTGGADIMSGEAAWRLLQRQMVRLQMVRLRAGRLLQHLRAAQTEQLLGRRAGVPPRT